MPGVTRIGGVFFKAEDPKALQDWYAHVLGVEPTGEGYTVFRWGAGSTVWSVMSADTDYLGPSEHRWMINYRVDDLDGLLAKLRSHGVAVDEETMEDENGKFAWCRDPEGNRVELWEPARGR